MSNEMRSTASTWRSPPPNEIDRSLTARSGSAVTSMQSPERLARIKGIANRFADEDQKRQHDRNREEAGESEPWRLDVGLALRQQFAKRGRARRQAETEEAERGQRHHRRRQDERQ